MLTVWGRTNSINVQKVMWTIGELGLDHERLDAGGAFGGLGTETYGEMNPNRRIPVLKDGAVSIWESQACVRYLAAAYGTGSLWHSDAYERSLADRWMEWKVTTIQPQLHVLFWGLVRTPAAERNKADIQRASVDIQPIWGILDQHLSNQAFMAGDKLTMGDIPLGCAWWRYSHLNLEHPDYPNIQRWFETLKVRPAYQDHVMIDVT